MRRGSLRWRLLLAGAVSIVAALALSGVALTLLFERHVERRVEAELGVTLDQIVAGIERDAEGRLFLSRPPADPRFARPLSGLYWQLQAGGEVVRSRSLWDATLALPDGQRADGLVQRHRVAGPDGAALILLERSVGLPGRLGGGIATAAVGLSAADLAAATRAFAIDLLPYLGLLAAFLVGAAWLQVTVGLKPLGRVRAGLAAIRAGAAARLGEGFPAEIRPLAAEVDALLEEREGQVARARARAGDLAHGLRTPLQVLAGDAARLRGRGEAEIAAEIEELTQSMRRHVERELARARMAAGRADARAEVGAVAEQVVAVLQRTPAGARLAWAVEVPPGAAARIDPADLADALGNLAENAARHARRRVAVRGGAQGALMRIAVVDDGPGIPPDRMAQALARGGTLDLGGGAGLGLAIVGDIAEAWAGRLELHSSEAGLEAALTLPAA